MRLALVGSEGSIGKKRGALLENMGHSVTKYDVGNPFGYMDATKVDAVFICTPPQTLVGIALDCVNAGKPYFLEKPGAANFREFLPLSAATETKKLTNMVACNLRFTTEYKAIQESLPNIGKPLYANAEFGYFLPFWRSGEYRTYYSCFRMSGGGILMDAIHELDYMSDLFGMPNKIRACLVKIENSGELSELDAEDSASLMCLYQNGPAITIHVDYLQRAYKRTFSAVGTKGRIDQVFNVQGSTQMYRKEMEHFLHCVKTGEESINPVWRWRTLLDFVDQMRNLNKAEAKDEPNESN